MLLFHLGMEIDTLEKIDTALKQTSFGKHLEQMEQEAVKSYLRDLVFLEFDIKDVTVHEVCIINANTNFKENELTRNHFYTVSRSKLCTSAIEIGSRFWSQTFFILVSTGIIRNFVVSPLIFELKENVSLIVRQAYISCLLDNESLNTSACTEILRGSFVQIKFKPHVLSSEEPKSHLTEHIIISLRTCSHRNQTELKH